jgi:hypothetical protein
LKKYSHLFRVSGIINGDGGKFWRSSGAEFLFADSEYNPMTGNLTNYGPKQVKELFSDLDKFKVTTKFKTFVVNSPPGNLTSNSFFYVKIFVPSVFREAAEKRLGYKLPDEMIMDAGKILKATSKDSGNRIIAATGTSAELNYKSGNLSATEEKALSKTLKLEKTNYTTLIQSQAATLRAIGTKGMRRNSTGYLIGMVRGSSNPANNPIGKVRVPDGYPMRYGGSKIPRKASFDASGNVSVGAHWGTWKGNNYIIVHKNIVDRLTNALNDTLAYYGSDMRRLVPSACVINNTFRSGSLSGMHNIGYAIDMDAGNNPYGEGKAIENKSTFVRKIYRPFLDIMQHHGFHNLGRDWKELRNRRFNDWMHFQAALTVAATLAGVKPYTNREYKK